MLHFSRISKKTSIQCPTQHTIEPYVKPYSIHIQTLIEYTPLPHLWDGCQNKARSITVEGERDTLQRGEREIVQTGEEENRRAREGEEQKKHMDKIPIAVQRARRAAPRRG